MTAGFQNQNPEFRKSVSLKEDMFSLHGHYCWRCLFTRSNSSSITGLVKIIASCLTNLKSLGSLGSLLLQGTESFRELPNLPCSEKQVKIMHIPCTEYGFKIKKIDVV